MANDIKGLFGRNDIQGLKEYCVSKVKDYDFTQVRILCGLLAQLAGENDKNKEIAIEILTYLNDRKF